MKKLGVAAALLILCAFSAGASNFRGGDQVYIPAGGHFQGASGTFISDISIANLSPDEVDVTVIYQPIGAGGGTGQEFKNVIALKAFERKDYKDFFVTALNIDPATRPFGLLVINGCLKGADCSKTTQDDDGFSPFFRDISATSRVYQIPTGSGANPKTTGQLFTGIPWYHFVSSLQTTAELDKVFIPGIRFTGEPGTDGTYRTNIGLVNASQYSSTTLVVTAYQGTLSAADRKGTFEVRLGPLGSAQPAFKDMFPGLTGEGYFVTVEQRNNEPTGDVPQGCVQGCPAFLAYGSLLDNGSGDATTLEAQYLKPLSEGAIAVIYPNGSGKSSLRRSVRH